MNAPLAIALLLALPCWHTVGADTDDPDKVRITGLIVDADDKPAPGVEVRDSRGLTTARTGADGRFHMQLDSSTARYTRLIATRDHDAWMAMWEPSDTNSRFMGTVLDVRLVLKSSRAVKASVVDSAGKPVPGTDLAARHGYDFVSFATSDALGRAILRVPEDAKVTEIVAVKAGVGFDYYENKASAKWLDVKPLPAEVTLTLDGVTHFQVRAVDTKGKPIPGVEFCPWTVQKPDKSAYSNLSGAPARFPITRTTDADGLATFDCLPAQMNRSVSMLARGEGWHQQKDPAWPPKDDAVGNPPVIETTLLRCATATGMVLHADGKPAAGILLQAEGHGRTNHYCRKVVRTRADGSFEFTLSPELSYLVAVTEEHWAAPSASGFIVHEGDERADLLFTLGKGTLVSGKVTHVVTGEPLRGKTVTVVQQGAKIDGDALKGPFPVDRSHEHLVRWTETDAQGRYSIRLGPGRYEVSADSAQEDRGEIYVGEQPEMQRDFRITPHE